MEGFGVLRWLDAFNPWAMRTENRAEPMPGVTRFDEATMALAEVGLLRKVEGLSVVLFSEQTEVYRRDMEMDKHLKPHEAVGKIRAYFPKERSYAVEVRPAIVKSEEKHLSPGKHSYSFEFDRWRARLDYRVVKTE